MHTAPDKREGDTSKAPPVSRIQKLRNDAKDPSFEPEMPPVICCEYLIGYLWEVGPVVAAGMGDAPVSFSELACWQSISGVTLKPWEGRTLRRLSVEYHAESHKAADRERPPPWKPEGFVVDRSEVAKSMKAAMARLANDDFD